MAGSAAALVATGAVVAGEATRRAKVLEVVSGDRRELALVDVCVSTEVHVGARALWHVGALRAPAKPSEAALAPSPSPTPSACPAWPPWCTRRRGTIRAGWPSGWLGTGRPAAG